MEIGKTTNLYLTLIYVYLRAYGEAVSDFEGAVKDVGYSDIALMSVRQKYREKIDRIAREISE